MIEGPYFALSEKYEKVQIRQLQRLLELYTPQGILNETERIGYSPTLPYPVDSPFTPDLEIIYNQQYHYYEQILIDCRPIEPEEMEPQENEPIEEKLLRQEKAFIKSQNDRQAINYDDIMRYVYLFLFHK